MSRALAEDRRARRVVGSTDVGHEAGLEALAQAILDRCEVAGRAVGGDHQLAARVVERVEGVEELLLGGRLALEELDVVDQEHVHAAKATLERVLAVVPPPRAETNSLVNASTVVYRTVRPPPKART